MPDRPRTRRRLIVPLVLATVLAGEVAGLAAAARHADLEAAPVPSPAADVQVPAPSPAEAIPATPRPAVAIPDDEPSAQGPAAALVDARPAGQERVRPAPNRGAVPRPHLQAEAESVSTGPGTRRGRNHVWIPSLGISRSVESFPCDRTRPPDDYVYRWGCAGRNNVYLLGHAHSVFKPLHDAFVGGRLRMGMTVDYADAKGFVRTYAVVWWKVTRPTGAAAWAWAPQERPSMTLQTCVGADSELRLMVRLEATS